MKSISAMPPDSAVAVTDAGASCMAAWDGYVRGHATASVYHLAAWRELIESVFDRETHYLLAENSGQIRGVLPLVRLKSLLFGDFLVSMPYVSYGGVLADDASTCARLIESATSLGRELDVAHVELRHLADCTSLPKRLDKVSMRLRLSGDSDTLWNKLGSKVRAQVKRPQKEGAESEIGGEELVEDFYTVFSVKYRDLGVPVYPLTWFRAILQRFPELARVFVVRVAGHPVAASVVIGFNGKLEVPWASSLRSADRYGVNMYLYWSMLKYAEEQGYEIFDFGRSTQGSGTFRFKKQWGAEPVQLYWHYWLRDTQEIPQLNPANPKFQAAVAVWRKLPVWMANRIGPQIVKNLP
ncbi:MAG: FemAB family XrtA/PEP-CTERM system-associated protein [Woeseia sp.]